MLNAPPQKLPALTDKEMRLSLSVRFLIRGDVAATHYVIYVCLYSLDYFQMLGKQAKILSPADVADLLTFADCTRNPIRNRVIVLLSAKAGMRACEIANLTWDMVVNASGQVSNIIELRDHAAKKSSGRLIPMHPDIRDA